MMDIRELKGTGTYIEITSEKNFNKVCIELNKIWRNWGNQYPHVLRGDKYVSIDRDCLTNTTTNTTNVITDTEFLGLKEPIINNNLPNKWYFSCKGLSKEQLEEINEWRKSKKDCTYLLANISSIHFVVNCHIDNSYYYSGRRHELLDCSWASNIIEITYQQFKKYELNKTVKQQINNKTNVNTEKNNNNSKSITVSTKSPKITRSTGVRTSAVSGRRTVSSIARYNPKNKAINSYL